MTKEYLENILTEYGVAFTDSLADRLLKEFEPCEDVPGINDGSYNSIKTELKPCEDAISRDEVWDVMQELWGTSGELMDRLMALPPVNPQNCDTCEVGNPCLYCKHEFEPQERSDKK